ncbi:MAG: helix-turn-helix domain-containing protein [Candidatus Thorarchaeota archaeon]
MSKDYEIVGLREEIKELRKTVMMLHETMNELASKLQQTPSGKTMPMDANQYNVFANQESCIVQDMAWERLVELIRQTDSGFTAAELARQWGKSRSRTSEVLNQLVEEGRVTKFRDGRSIRFRSA